jgi:3-hydroxyacyl-CoA dehydrogenase/enoyl-CoA hydratase/3-hydroxybutyryl-CoA epimerase
LLCSNTSTLPITGLAEAVDRPEDFIGLHFFSPVDKMPLVEIIVGKKSSDAALARAYDVVQQIKKTPIVVNDSRGFYTSRVIVKRVNEGMAMLAEGMAPASLERAATQAGYPVGTLQLCDELNLELMAKIGRANRAATEAAGADWEETPGERVVTAMLQAGRSGKLGGAGFYDYEAGRRSGLWTGLADLFGRAETPIPLADMADRMLFTEVLETVKCFEEGVITSTAAANIGSIMGIGFPPMTGGAAQFVSGYIAADGSTGIAAFLRRADELAAAYGDRFAPTPALRALAETGGSLESLVP